MNYLAHLALSHNDPAIMIGNFIADDIPRREERDIPSDIMEGIILHRRIDEYTDDHSSFKEAVIKLRPHHRKYAPVVIDILNDHLLSLNWASFHDQKETDFHAEVYGHFETQAERLPPQASLHVQTLLEYEYLRAYGTKAGMKNVLARMDKRTRFPSDFASAVVHLYQDLEFYNDLFLQLFADLRAFISIK